MAKLINSVLIIGFLVVDFFFFHDIFKAGETTSFTQWLTGLLSILIIIVSVRSLLNGRTSSRRSSR